MKNVKYANCWGVIAVVMCAVCAGILFSPEVGMALAALPFFVSGPLMDQFEPEPSGGGGAGDFQKKVLDGIGKVKAQTEEIEKNFQSLDKESKKLGEDFAKHVKSFEGLPSQVADISQTVSKMQVKIASERRYSHGSGIDRIKANEQHRDAVNGVIRLSLIRQGKSVPITEAQKKAGEEYFERALATTGGSGASYINAELIPDIFSTVAEHGIWNRFDVVPVSTAQAKLIVDTTDPVMSWVAENTAPNETGYTSANVTAAIGKMLGWIQVSNELLADSVTDLTSHILGKFANATAFRLDFAATSADGGADATDGGYTGIFHAGTAAVAASGNVSVATLDFEDFLKAMLVVDASVLSKPSAAWVIHPRQLVRILGVKDLNGRPIFLPSTDAPALGAIGSILGYPVVLSHAAPSTDGASAKIAVFGDLMGNAICLRSDFEFAASDQAKFTEDSTVFRSRARGASKVRAAGSFGMLTNAAS